MNMKNDGAWNVGNSRSIGRCTDARCGAMTNTFSEPWVGPLVILLVGRQRPPKATQAHADAPLKILNGEQRENSAAASLQAWGDPSKGDQKPPRWMLISWQS